MSTHNIDFYEDLTKLSLNYHKISSNMHLISSAAVFMKNWQNYHSIITKYPPQSGYRLRPSFFYFLFYPFFSQQVRVGGRNKNYNKIHSDHFVIELKSKETRIVFQHESCFLRF